MKQETISKLCTNFDLASNKSEEIEFWFARDLQTLLGYDDWRNFLKVIEKAQTACQNARQETADHFVEVNKMVDLGSGARREVNGNYRRTHQKQFRRERFIAQK